MLRDWLLVVVCAQGCRFAVECLKLGLCGWYAGTGGEKQAAAFGNTGGSCRLGGGMLTAGQTLGGVMLTVGQTLGGVGWAGRTGKLAT